MRVELRLFTSLRSGRKNRYTLEVDDAATPVALAQQLGINLNEVNIVLVNGISSHMLCKLQEGDIVSFFPIIGGG
ncbi:MoaD/ThiS family protein [Clostridium bovifaecis]|uniref:MoaD/ThiS family protein n=1 Tax=Clostridium bovifaecis TaxID=2184719 RepID=A0A6I6ELC1_9CLOT|nr:MoaD/ThiS family protein [Clostridium bovifaecis]